MSRNLDPLTIKERSRQMGLVRSKDTKPEIAVRKKLWSMGYRYRLHPKNLPGRPDIVIGRLRKVIFVHGCFWHRHSGCSRTRMPKSNRKYWRQKFNSNVLRDEEVRTRLKKDGWEILVVWECIAGQPSLLEARLTKFLEGEQ